MLGNETSTFTVWVGQPISVNQIGLSPQPNSVINARSFSVCTSIDPSGWTGCE